MCSACMRGGLLNVAGGGGPIMQPPLVLFAHARALQFRRATAIRTKALRTRCRRTLCSEPVFGVPGGERHLRLPARLRPHGLRRVSAPVYVVCGPCACAAALDAAGRSLVHASLPLDAWWIILSRRQDGMRPQHTLASCCMPCF